MLSRLYFITVVFCSTFFLLGSAFGQKATVEADVKGVDGRPANAAQIRIERQDKKAAPMMVKTNWRGHVVVANLEVGTYKLTTIAGGVQSSQIIKTQSQKPVIVGVDLSKTSAVVSKGKKRMVWVPAPTGSMIGGGWVEVNDDGSVKLAPGMSPNGQNLDTAGRGEIERMQNRSFAIPGGTTR